MQTFRKRRAGLSATAGLSCLDIIFHVVLVNSVPTVQTFFAEFKMAKPDTSFIIWTLCMQQQFRSSVCHTHVLR